MIKFATLCSSMPCVGLMVKLLVIPPAPARVGWGAAITEAENSRTRSIQLGEASAEGAAVPFSESDMPRADAALPRSPPPAEIVG